MENVTNIPLHELPFTVEKQDRIPTFYVGEFIIEVANDTFLSTGIWTKVCNYLFKTDILSFRVR